jgi:hypothetical protein
MEPYLAWIGFRHDQGVRETSADERGGREVRAVIGLAMEA